MSLFHLLHDMFEGCKTIRSTKTGKMNALLSITDFFPAVKGPDIALLAASMNALYPGNWADIDAIVGIADRNSGTIVHQMALESNKPYTLGNWYPAGSKGDIVVEKSGGFTGGAGVVLLNGLKAGDKVVYVDDVIRSGASADAIIKAMQAANINVVHAVFAAEIHGRAGSETITSLRGVPCSSLCVVDVSGELSKLVHMSKLQRPLAASPATPTVAQIKALPKAVIKKKFENVMASFVGVSIYYADGSTYPYCNFCLTDFVPIMQPQLVEDMADCMVYLGDFGPQSPVQLIVSESDRGGGPLAIAIALRTGLPLTMANWSESPHNVGVCAEAKVGYSGHGSLYLNGVGNGSVCTVVDDMLSSGGTCEGLIKAVAASGGIVHEAIFASEKVNTGGRARLNPQWPNTILTSLCYFIAQGEKTVAHAPHPGSNATPLQQVPSAKAPKAKTSATKKTKTVGKKATKAKTKTVAKKKATSKKGAKKVAKKAVKKTAKKATKKAAKKVTKKAAKKGTKKTAKKAVKKNTKKAAKKPVKKANKKPVKRVAKKATKTA